MQNRQDTTKNTHTQEFTTLTFRHPTLNQETFTYQEFRVHQNPWQTLSTTWQVNEPKATYNVSKGKQSHSAEDKKARREAAEQRAQELKERIDNHLTDLHESLKNGHSDKVKELITFFATFHRYSLGNQILIAFQRPDATYVAGFQSWKEKGRSVKKGETGIIILAPMIGKRKPEEGDDKPQNRDRDEDESVVFGFRGVYVFDVSQTEGEPLPAMHSVTGEASSHLDRLIRYTIEQGITLEYANNLDGANGRSYMGTIRLLAGREPADEFRTLAHEIAHEILHPDVTIRMALSKTVKETEAEAVAYVVCQAMGLDMSTVSQDYIQLYQGSPEMLTASLERIRVASNKILTGLEDMENGKESKQSKAIPPKELMNAPQEKAPSPTYVTLSLPL
jgi:N-terminal domain of anti-restriction factor ArdC